MEDSDSYKINTSTEFDFILPNSKGNSNQPPNPEFGLESFLEKSLHLGEAQDRVFRFTDSERYWEKSTKNYTVIKHRFAASIKFVNRMFRGKSNIKLPKLTCAFLDFLLRCDRTQRNGEAKNSQGYFKAGWTGLTHKKVAKFLGCSLPTATSILVNCRAIGLIIQSICSQGKYWYKLNLKAYENLLASPLEFVQGILSRKSGSLSPTLSPITPLSDSLSNQLSTEITTLSSGLSGLSTPITTLSLSQISGENLLSRVNPLSKSLSVIGDNGVFSGFTYKNLYAAYKFLYPESAAIAYAATFSTPPLNIINQYQNLINNKFVCQNVYFFKKEKLNEKRQQGGGRRNNYGESREDRISDGYAGKQRIDQGEVLITGNDQTTQFKQGGQRAFRTRNKRIRIKRRFKRVQNICVRIKFKLAGDLAGCVAVGGLFDCQNEGLDREVKINPHKEQIAVLKKGFEALHRNLYVELGGQNEMGVAIAPMKAEGLHRNTFREMLKYPLHRVAIALCYSYLRVDKGYKFIANIDGFITQALREWDIWKENINMEKFTFEFNYWIEDINFVLANGTEKQNT